MAVHDLYLVGVRLRPVRGSMRETIGLVTQGRHLFHESVRANLLLVRPEAVEELVCVGGRHEEPYQTPFNQPTAVVTVR